MQLPSISPTRDQNTNRTSSTRRSRRDRAHLTSYFGGKRPLASVAFLAVALLVAPVAASLPGMDGPSVWLPSEKLEAVDPTPGDAFGGAVGLADDVAVVGAPGIQAAFVYERVAGDWVQTQELSSSVSPPRPGGGFGGVVAVADDVLVVGGGATPLHVYERMDDEWIVAATLPAATSVDVEGDVLAAVDWRASELSVYERGVSAWGWTGTYTVAGTTCLGSDVVVDREVIAVSEVCAADEIYLFGPDEVGGWVETTSLTTENADFLGLSLGLDVEAGVLVAPDPGTASVAVFEIRAGEWQVAAILEPGDEWIDEQRYGGLFGWSVSLDGRVFVVGAPIDDRSPGLVPVPVDEDIPVDCSIAPPTSAARIERCIRTGAAYVFQDLEEIGWTRTQKVTAPDGFDKDRFGQAVALDGGSLMVGAPFRDVGTLGDVLEEGFGMGMDRGFVQVFQVPGDGLGGELA